MKAYGPLLWAGSTFTAGAVAGVLAGYFVYLRTGHGLWVVGGLFVGLALGSYGAVRALSRNM